jgi:hypothetical protein
MTKEQIDDLKTKGLIKVMQNEIRDLLWQAHNRLDDARKLDDFDKHVGNAKELISDAEQLMAELRELQNNSNPTP